METRVALITGASGGIGLAAARALAEKGVKVYGVSRKPGEDAAYTWLFCDVTDENACKTAVSEIIGREGHIDILVNNAGFGISGATEFTASREARGLMEVNLFGADNMTRAVLPHMRERKRGSIVFLSSVAGPLAIPYQNWYSVSKAAVLAYAKALRNEVRPFGIGVTAVLPGDTKTGFTAARQKSIEGDGLYDGRISRSVARMEKDEQTGADPSAVGTLIAKAALKKRPAPMYTCGILYKTFLLIARLTPERFVSWVIGKMYGE